MAILSLGFTVSAVAKIIASYITGSGIKGRLVRNTIIVPMEHLSKRKRTRVTDIKMRGPRNVLGAERLSRRTMDVII